MPTGKRNDLTHQKIGMLTILERKYEKNKTYYYCECECGNKNWIRGDALTKKNPTLSCGCLSKKMQFKSKNITGIKYKNNMLTPIKYTGIGKGQNELWICKCDCGNEVKVLKKNIYATSKTSCGCRAKKQLQECTKIAHKVLKETDLIEGTSINRISRKEPIKSNTSGFTGVSYDTKRNKWLAQIWFKGKHYHLGRFDTKDEAIEIRQLAKENLHEEFLRKIKSEK